LAAQEVEECGHCSRLVKTPDRISERPLRGGLLFCPLMAQSGQTDRRRLMSDPVARVALAHEMLKLARELDAEMVDAKWQ
jgi:hypothetical protein